MSAVALLVSGKLGKTMVPMTTPVSLFDQEADTEAGNCQGTKELPLILQSVLPFLGRFALIYTATLSSLTFPGPFYLFDLQFAVSTFYSFKNRILATNK